MNILLFLKNLKGRGVSKVYINLAKAFKKSGYTPYLVLREDIIEFDTNLDITIFNNNITNNIDNFIKEKKIDYIISNNVEYIEGLKNIDANRIFYTVHMLWGERIFKQLRFKKLCKLRRDYKDKQIIAISNAVKEDLLYKVKIKPKTIDIIPDIFDFEEISKKADEFMPEFKDYIVNVGSLDSVKNHKLLLKIFAKLDNEYKLLIIGKGKDESSLKKLANKLNISDKVEFLGFMKNPYPYIKNAKLMLLTSKNEGLPGVAIESMFLNTPVVSTASKGIKDILINEYSKFIVDKKNLLSATKKALNSYPKIDTEFYKNSFSYKSIIDKYETIWKQRG